MGFGFRYILPPLFVGNVIAWLFWYFRTNRRRTLRFIDFISHLLAIAGLLWSLTAVGNYQKKFQLAYERMRFNDPSLDLQFEALHRMNEVCWGGPPSREKQRDCDVFGSYLLDLRKGASAHDKVPFPPLNANDFTSKDIRTLVVGFSKKFEEYNETIRPAHRSGLTADDFNEYAFLTYVVQVLSLAFGLGIMRRGLDLYTDWGPR